MHERESRRKAPGEHGTPLDRFRIAIDGQHAARCAIEQRLRVAATAERRVDVNRVCARRNRLKHLVEEHGYMIVAHGAARCCCRAFSSAAAAALRSWKTGA